jgi:hypothetical protein
MPPQSSIKFLATALVCQAVHAIGKKLLLKQIHQQCWRIVFPISLGFGWNWELLCEAQLTREVKSLNPSSSGSGNLALEKVPW